METQKNKIAIVILNWNGIKWLDKFLPSIVKYSNTTPIYIIDNNSNDDSVKFIRTNYPLINIVKNKDNFGYAKGYNIGLENIKFEYYILINSDVEVTDNWINPIIELMDKNTDVSACQPKILSYIDKRYFEYAGASGGFIDFLGYPYCRGRIFDSIEVDKGQYNDIKEIFWATGACLFIRAKHFNEVGGFDGDFFAHQEEIDLCWRLKNKGYKIMINPNSVVYHYGGGTLDSGSPKKTYLNFRNNLYMLFKNLHFLHLIYIISIRLILDGFAAFSFLNKRSGLSHMLSIFKAHVVFYVNIPKLIFKRLKISQKKLNSCMYNKSIVFKYKIQKIKKFEDL